MIETIELEFGGAGREDSRIVKAAVWAKGIVYLGWRHSEIFLHLIAEKVPSHFFKDPTNHGFIDQYNLFYTRAQAGIIAFRMKQSKELHDQLFSEVLWDLDGTPRNGGVYDPAGDEKHVRPK